ncbi:MAG: hypothetical protein R6U96_05995 [Promethearchaeia archaeon]
MKSLKQKLAPISYFFHFVKPAIKGIILVIIGLIITRQSVGIGRLNLNFLYGIPSYFLFGLAALSLYSKMENGKSRGTLIFTVGTLLRFVVFLSLGAGLLIFHILLNNIDFVLLLYVGIINGVWIGLAFLYLRGIKKRYTKLLFSNLIFSFGIIYGAILNTLAFSYIIVLFFLATFFLQCARDLLNFTHLTYKTEQKIVNPIKESFYSQLFSAVFLTLALFFGVAYQLFYLYPLIASLVVFTFTIYLTYKLSNRRRSTNRLEKLLKLLVYLELLAFVLAS